jgi:hypothetical protein
MKRTLVLALGLLIVPAFVSAQVEVGLDAGFNLTSIDDADDKVNSFAVPAQWARIAFAAGPTLLVESLIGFDYVSEGDFNESVLLLMPGVNFLVGEQFYIRGEAGLLRIADQDDSAVQYAFGGGVGMRRPLGDAALLRLEVAADRFLENTDDFLPAHTDIRAGVGISAVIN